MGKNWGLLLAVLAVSACAPKAANNSWNRPAPRSQAETGVIVEASKSSVEKFTNKNNLQARQVSGDLFEVYGVSTEKVKEAFPSSFVTHNVYFENLISNSKPQLSIEQVFLQDGPAPSPSPAAGSASSRPGRCVSDNNMPKAVLTPLVHQTEIAHGLLQRDGMALNFTSQGSEANALYPSNLLIRWAAVLPESSGSQPIMSSGPTFSFTPTAMGLYRVIMMVQDERGVCAGKDLYFLVTANTAYQGRQNTTPLSAQELARFDHLPVLNAQEAWSKSRGNGVLIAVLDTGVNYNHPDLANNIFVNKGEVAGNGIDDDKNGFVDDVTGWNFAYNNNTPYDDNEHGTHVAGLAAAQSFGLAPEATILPVKVFHAAGGGDLASIVGGIKYAADMGAKIINASFGSYGADFAQLNSAISYAQARGILFVAAAGNGDQRGVGVDTDTTPNYPSALTLDSILAVAATDLGGTLSSFSNFGATSVDVAVTGGTVQKGLWSSYYENPMNQKYVALQGTSMATPVTCGIAALVWSANPNLNFAQVKQILMKSGSPLPQLQGKVVSNRFLNAYQAVIQATAKAE